MADITPRKKIKGTVYEARWFSERLNKYRTKTFPLRRDAAAWLANVDKFEEDEAKAAEQATAPTVGKILNQWLLAAETTGTADNEPVQAETLRHYKSEAETLRALRMLDGRRFGEYRVSELTTGTMKQVKSALLLEHSRPSARRFFARMRMAFSQAVHLEIMTVDPARNIRIPIDARHKTDRDIPEESEVEALLRAADTLAASDDVIDQRKWRRYRLMLNVLVFTGMRPSELRALPAKAINPDFPMIEVSQKAEENGKISSPKTAAGHRVIRIQEGLWRELLAWIETSGADPDALVFPGLLAGKVQCHTHILSDMWRPLQLAAGLVGEPGESKYTLYSLRHFYASTEIAMGANPKELQEAMGHAKIQMTLDIYAHLFKKRDGGGQAVRAEMRAKRLAGDRPEEKSPTVVTFKRAG